MNFQVWNSDGSVVMILPVVNPRSSRPPRTIRRFVLGNGCGGSCKSTGSGNELQIGPRRFCANPRAPDCIWRVFAGGGCTHQIDRDYQRAIVALLIVALVVFAGGLALAEVGVRRQTRR